MRVFLPKLSNLGCSLKGEEYARGSKWPSRVRISTLRFKLL